MHVARDNVSNDLVAIKIVKWNQKTESMERNLQLLRDWMSRFIVKYNKVFRRGDELWV